MCISYDAHVPALKFIFRCDIHVSGQRITFAEQLYTHVTYFNSGQDINVMSVQSVSPLQAPHPAPPHLTRSTRWLCQLYMTQHMLNSKIKTSSRNQNTVQMRRV